MAIVSTQTDCPWLFESELLVSADGFACIRGGFFHNLLYAHYRPVQMILLNANAVFVQMIICTAIELEIKNAIRDRKRFPGNQTDLSFFIYVFFSNWVVNFATNVDDNYQGSWCSSNNVTYFLWQNLLHYRGLPTIKVSLLPPEP